MIAHTLRADLESSLGAHHPIHLDGVLLAARERLEDKVDLARPLDCVALDRGVYRTTAGLMICDDIAGSDVMKLKRTWRLRTEDPNAMAYMRLRDASGKPVAKESRVIPLSSNPYKSNYRDQEILRGVTAVIWQFVGDAEKVLDLARNIHCIGASSATGFGRVRDWSLVEGGKEMGEGAGWFVDGRVLRNLPVELAPAGTFANGRSVTQGMGRVAPPYWDPEGHRECFMPVLASLVVSQDVADERLGLAA